MLEVDIFVMTFAYELGVLSLRLQSTSISFLPKYVPERAKRLKAGPSADTQRMAS
jgi:hypothetical protein